MSIPKKNESLFILVLCLSGLWAAPCRAEEKKKITHGHARYQGQNSQERKRYFNNFGNTLAVCKI